MLKYIVEQLQTLLVVRMLTIWIRFPPGACGNDDFYVCSGINKKHTEDIRALLWEQMKRLLRSRCSLAMTFTFDYALVSHC